MEFLPQVLGFKDEMSGRGFEKISGTVVDIELDVTVDAVWHLALPVVTIIAIAAVVKRTERLRITSNCFMKPLYSLWVFL